jgi:uncharacterized protein YbjT (DUF2867 family)
MKVILFGASGMVGQGVLRECLLDDAVTSVVSVGRSPVGQHHAKLRDVVVSDLFDLNAATGEFAGADACFFCLGVSSAGMSEAEYTRITHDLTLSVAHTLRPINPEMTFVYVSGEGTDSTEQGKSMWARVKGRTENELLAMFAKAYMFRPGFIQPMHGERSKTRLYRIAYVVAKPVFPAIRRMAPKVATTTVQIGRAMLTVARTGAPSHILATQDINQL